MVDKDLRAGGVVHRVRLITSAGKASGPARATREAAELDMQRLVGKPEQEQPAELERISQAAWTDRALMAFREVLDWHEKHGDVPRRKRGAAQNSLWRRWEKQRIGACMWFG